MAEKTEGKYAGEFLLSDAPGKLSREKVTVLSGQNLLVGAVVGRVSIGVGRANIPTVSGTGNGTMTVLYAAPDLEKGSYLVKCTAVVAHGGVFSVTAPSGKVLAPLTLTAGSGNTTKYRSSHINFSITDGSTDFAVNDLFTIVVETGAPTVIGTGNGIVSAITLGPQAKPGRYLVEAVTTITNGGEFKIVGPDGEVVAVGAIVAGAGGTLILSDQEQLNITITDGSTDFAVGAKFEIFAFNEGERGKGKIVAWNPVPSTFDGRQYMAGILYDAVDASAADKTGVIVTRQAEVRESDLDWLAAISAGEKEVAKQRLGDLGIAVR